jgi:hypothetical protein
VQDAFIRMRERMKELVEKVFKSNPVDVSGLTALRTVLLTML